jgi:hypothetical protein
MIAPNHALTGALIGLSIGTPWIALPLAFLSHFICDAIPHYDVPGSELERIGSARLLYEQVLLGAGLCFLLVMSLFVTKPEHWFTAAVCAFLATSPDLFWIPRFIHVRRTGKDVVLKSWFLRFHNWIQWKTAPRLIWVEIVWFTGSIGLMVAKIS